MAKRPHKFAWNGVDIDTVLSARDLAAICAQAAIESTGDLWNGKQKIDKVEDGDGWTLYVIKNSILGWQKPMSFSVDISADDGRTKLTTTIHTYTTTQQTVLAFIPVSPKKMVAHHTYMQFAHKVANTVRAADPAARIRIREGVEGASSFSAPAPAPAPAPARVSTVAPASLPAASTTPTPPTELLPPPPPPPAATEPPPPPAPSPAAPLAPPVHGTTSAVADPEVTTPQTDDALDDATRKVPRRPRAARTWELVFPDGSTMPVSAMVFVGRDPASDISGAQFAIVPDSERLVSKTHAMFDVRDGTLFVTDLHSANGTFLLAPNGEETQSEPDAPTAMGAGWEVELGSYPIIARTVR